MGILKGNVSGRWFRVVASEAAGEALAAARGDDALAAVIGLPVGVQRMSFRPIDLERGGLESMGWVNIRSLLDNELTLDKVLFGDLARSRVVALGLRVDRIRINQPVYKARVAKAIRAKVRETGRMKLPKVERVAIEEKIRTEMVKRAEPRTQCGDFVWHVGRGLAWASAPGAKAALMVAEVFADTFGEKGFELEPLGPYLSRATRWADANGLTQELLELLPAPMSPDAPAEINAGEED